MGVVGGDRPNGDRKSVIAAEAAFQAMVAAAGPGATVIGERPCPSATFANDQVAVATSSVGVGGTWVFSDDLSKGDKIDIQKLLSVNGLAGSGAMFYQPGGESGDKGDASIDEEAEAAFQAMVAAAGPGAKVVGGGGPSRSSCASVSSIPSAAGTVGLSGSSGCGSVGGQSGGASAWTVSNEVGSWVGVCKTVCSVRRTV